jgi:hypothetical protein
MADVFENDDQTKDYIKQRIFVWFSSCVSNNMDFFRSKLQMSHVVYGAEVHRKLLIFKGNSVTEITGF